MAFYIKDEATDLAVRDLAKLKNKSLTETVREAVENERNRLDSDTAVPEWLKVLQDEISRYPRTGLKADKAFFDSLED